MSHAHARQLKERRLILFSGRSSSSYSSSSSDSSSSYTSDGEYCGCGTSSRPRQRNKAWTRFITFNHSNEKESIQSIYIISIFLSHDNYFRFFFFYIPRPFLFYTLNSTIIYFICRFRPILLLFQFLTIYKKIGEAKV